MSINFSVGQFSTPTLPVTVISVIETQSLNNQESILILLCSCLLAHPRYTDPICLRNTGWQRITRTDCNKSYSQSTSYDHTLVTLSNICHCVISLDFSTQFPLISTIVPISVLVFVNYALKRLYITSELVLIFFLVSSVLVFQRQYRAVAK
jgi:hypothetical protein